MNYCLTCQKPTSNPKFCSRSCSAKTNGRLYPKRKLTNQCKICNIPIVSNRTYCKTCSPNFVDWDNIKLSDVQGKRQYQKNSRIRDLARTKYRESGKPLVCSRCGYSKHVEICHIRSISSFDGSATISEINSFENLITLCRNCHWELDHGSLTL